MPSPVLSPLGSLILPSYLAINLLIGWLSRRKEQSSNSFLNASRALPLWIVSASFLAANCGALEIIGLSALAAQHGVQAFHFYWIGAVPAMIFLSAFMLPLYRRMGVRSVPEFLEIRFGPGVRRLNACILAVSMLMLAGISLYAMAQVLTVLLGLNFLVGAGISAAVVLAYSAVGGIRATIYTEVFQLVVIVSGLVPLFLRTVPLAFTTLHGGGIRWHLWRGMPLVSPTAPLDAFGTIFGLGFVLSFGYWCTDFVLMQRAFTAKSSLHARQVPLWAGLGKVIFSLLVVLPGLVAYRVLPDLGTARSFDQVLPRMMHALYGPTLLGLGLTGLAASLMSGLAANVTGFAAIWTEDIYRSWLRPCETETHYLAMGRVAIVAATVIGVAASFASFYFSNLMDHVQLIFSITTAPFWAIFLLGASTRSVTARGAFWGLAAGVAAGGIHRVLWHRHLLSYGSVMSANFYGAAYAFGAACAMALLIRRSVKVTAGTALSNPGEAESGGSLSGRGRTLLLLLSAVLLLICTALNLLWW